MTDTVYLGPVVTLLVVAVALGINNFAGAIGIGVSGAGRAVRVRVAAVFGLFETAMPVVGLLLGRGMASGLGSAARWTGAGLLVAVGVYQLFSRGDSAADPNRWAGWRLLVTGAALSLDNLAVGFALGTVDVPVVVAVIVFGVVSVAMSLAGLELGARLGTVVGDKGRIIAGIALIGVGAAMAAGWLLSAAEPLPEPEPQPATEPQPPARAHGWPTAGAMALSMAHRWGALGCYPGGSGGRLPSSSRSNSPSLTPSTKASHSDSVKYSLSPSGSPASNMTYSFSSPVLCGAPLASVVMMTSTRLSFSMFGSVPRRLHDRE